MIIAVQDLYYRGSDHRKVVGQALGRLFILMIPIINSWTSVSFSSYERNSSRLNYQEPTLLYFIKACHTFSDVVDMFLNKMQ